MPQGPALRGRGGMATSVLPVEEQFPLGSSDRRGGSFKFCSANLGSLPDATRAPGSSPPAGSPNAYGSPFGTVMQYPGHSSTSPGTTANTGQNRSSPSSASPPMRENHFCTSRGLNAVPSSALPGRGGGSLILADPPMLHAAAETYGGSASSSPGVSCSSASSANSTTAETASCSASAVRRNFYAQKMEQQKLEASSAGFGGPPGINFSASNFSSVLSAAAQNGAAISDSVVRASAVVPPGQASPHEDMYPASARRAASPPRQSAPPGGHRPRVPGSRSGNASPHRGSQQPFNCSLEQYNQKVMRQSTDPTQRHQYAVRGAPPTQQAQQEPEQTGAEAVALRIVRKVMELSNDPCFDWSCRPPLVTASEMFELCDQVFETVRHENSLIDVQLPCRVYGDIHGQLPDLLHFFNAFSWPDKRRGDIFAMNYIFLGDFVDRGNYSADVVTLLFALKVLYPNKIYLVRGNHEDRLMNQNYGFLHDCGFRFPDAEPCEQEEQTLGYQVWDRVNDTFEFLPISALVEGVILCIHGGIGDSIFSLDDLRDIPKPIRISAEINEETTRQDRVVLDALWSDPTDNDAVLGVHLSPRGQNTCRFGPDRVQEFNKRNGLKMIIRAHECVQYGYEYFANGQLLTVFSATNYCNQYNNDGAMVVLVRNPDGSVVEHAQVIRSGTGEQPWPTEQFRDPSPMRGGQR
ncbi:unnamed protein product [Amoebophrya sp. A25]|nr:unnamed protein product [Amoebophrya sp. A25]|eukprot:GSA25T00021583001.1